MALKKQPIAFGKYFLLDRINIGGMAEVWRAKLFGEQGFEKVVAIKRILPNIAEDDDFIAMFLDEAKITVQLTHANIAQVFDLDKVVDSYFIAMEYVAGRDLRAIFDRCRKRNEPAPIPLVCYAVSKMCEGLDYAHRKKDNAGNDLNIVHRDVSPQNCLVSFDGEVKVIDFGIAKAANKATKTQAGILKGKFGYMSPEQVRGLPLDQRSDVFACGVVLYELLTGERLFIGDSDFSVLEKVRQVDILPPTKYNRRIPEGLEKIVLKALTKDPEERYQWASDLSEALQRFLITSDSVFSRQQLMQYMRSTFAEDVEREKIRQAEYATFKLPAGLAALHGAVPAGAMGLGQSAPMAGPPVLAPSIPRQMTPPPPPPAAQRPPPPPPPPPPAPAASHDTTTPGLPTHGRVDDRTQAGGPLLDDRTLAGGPLLDDRTLAGDPLFGDRTQAGDPLFEGTQPGDGPEPALFGADMLGQARPAAPPPPRIPTSPHRPIPPVAAPPRATPAGRPLPPQLGEPAGRALPRNHALPPPDHVPAGGYKPRMAEPAQAPRDPRRKWIPVAIGGAVGLLVVIALAISLLGGGEGGVFCEYAPKDAVLLLDGVQHCSSSPCVASKVKAGAHRLEVRKEHHETFALDITVPRGDFFHVAPEVKLAPIHRTIPVVVATDPADAETRIDGKVVKELGRPGLFAGELTTGEPHEVVVSKPGYLPWKKIITLAPGDPQLIQFVGPLKPAVLQVKFTSAPAGAKVLVNGQAVGQTPLDLDTLDPAATHAIVFQKGCYQDATHTILPGGGTQKIDKQLVKKSSCP